VHINILNLNTYLYMYIIHTSSYVKSRRVFSASRCRRWRFHSLSRLQTPSRLKSPAMSTSASLFCDNTRNAAVRLREKSWSIARIQVVIAGGIRRQPQHLPALLQCLWLNAFLGSHVTGERRGWQWWWRYTIVATVAMTRARNNYHGICTCMHIYWRGCKYIHIFFHAPCSNII